MYALLFGYKILPSLIGENLISTFCINIIIANKIKLCNMLVWLIVEGQPEGSKLIFQITDLSEVFKKIIWGGDWTLITESNFSISISLQPCGVNSLFLKYLINVWTDRTQILHGTSRDPREGLWMIKISKICVYKFFIFVKFLKILNIREFFSIKSAKFVSLF